LNFISQYSLHTSDISALVKIIDRRIIVRLVYLINKNLKQVPKCFFILCPLLLILSKIKSWNVHSNRFFTEFLNKILEKFYWDTFALSSFLIPCLAFEIKTVEAVHVQGYPELILVRDIAEDFLLNFFLDWFHALILALESTNQCNIIIMQVFLRLKSLWLHWSNKNNIWGNVHFRSFSSKILQWVEMSLLYINWNIDDRINPYRLSISIDLFHSWKSSKG